MRFLLINPYCPITEGPTPPLGISFLAAALEKAGVDVKILDLVIFPYSQKFLKDVLSNFEPDIVGSTAVTMTFNDAIQVIKDVKAINPDILTVMGGPHVSFCAKETLDGYSELDVIALGEGEATIVEIVEEYRNSKDWSRIKSLAYRSGNDVIINEKRDFLDVNTLPLPARHLLPLGRYRALHTPISMTTSRGCPHRCIFCVGRKMVGARVRYRNPIDVVDEFEYLTTLDFPQINIADDLFTAKKAHCLTICNEIILRKLNIKWSSFSRVDTISPEVLEAMREAGCTSVSFGVETANVDILKTIKKGITLEKVKRAIRMCNEAGVEPHVSFILGLPGETEASLIETQNFGKEIEQIGACYGFHLLAPFPGTAIRDENDKYDLDIITDDWSQYHANRAIVETSNVNKDMLNIIAEQWDKDTHEKLFQIRNKMDSGEATEDEEWQIKNLERFLFLYQLMMDKIIEENGTWINGVDAVSDNEVLKTLANKIHIHMEKTPDEAFDILDYAFKRSSIKYIHSNRQIRWEWQNYL